MQPEPPAPPPEPPIDPGLTVAQAAPEDRDEFILPGAASAAPLKRRAALSGVGRTNDMVASECESACHWNGPLYNGTALDVEMTIEAARFGEWATAVKRIVAMDLFQGGKPDLCMGPGYIW